MTAFCSRTVQLEKPARMPHIMGMTKRPASSDTPEVITLGCRLNAYESAQMRALGVAAGVSDAVVINTCAVTNEAVRQARQTIRKTRRADPDRKIIVTGCAVQIDPEAFAAMDEVDAVLGNIEKLDAKSWVALGRGAAPGVSDIMQADYVTRAELPAPPPQMITRAHVQVQNGCDHRCTFCIIPFGRGNSRSVSPEDVVTEIRGLVAAGVPEIVITGVDITSWGADLDGAPQLGELIHRILLDVPELPQLRLSSIDGAEIDPRLFELITQHPRIAPHIHLSLQAGDNMILKRMKRRHTREDAIRLCQDIRAARPEMVFGADIIAGFPTETEQMFEQSLSLIDECGLTYTHVFPYSARTGTPAAKMPAVNGRDIKARAARLRAKGDQALGAFLASQINQVGRVLTEKPKRNEQSQLIGMGRLANFAEVKFTAMDEKLLQAGQFVDVDLIRHDAAHLFGTAQKLSEIRI